MTVGGRVGALWIGGLEPYMDEAFLQVSHRTHYATYYTPIIYIVYNMTTTFPLSFCKIIFEILCIYSFQNAMNMMGESGVVSIKVSFHKLAIY